LLALAGAVTLLVSACVINYEPVNLNVIDSRDSWSDNYRGGRTAEPAGR
jgi:hypothetical protein